MQGNREFSYYDNCHNPYNNIRLTSDSMNVFIVEDDQVLLLMLNKMITRLGYNVCGTSIRGAEAINGILETDPDLILMDIQLKDKIDGIEVTSEIKKKKDYPVIYITGNSDHHYRIRAEKYGFADYMIKPVTLDDLKAAISRSVGL
jgi:two-component system, response regulator PdtaR